MAGRENVAPETAPKTDKPVAPRSVFWARLHWPAISACIGALVLVFLIGGLYLTIGNKSEALNNRITTKTDALNREITDNKVKLGVLEERTGRMETDIGKIETKVEKIGSNIDRIGLKLDEAIGKSRKTELDTDP